MPIRHTGVPPRCASQTIAVSAPDHRAPALEVAAVLVDDRLHHARASGTGRLRPGFASSSKISPTRLEAVGVAAGYGNVADRALDSGRSSRTQPRAGLARHDVGEAVVLVEDAVGVGEIAAKYCASPFGPMTRSKPPIADLVLGRDRRPTPRAPRDPSAPSTPRGVMISTPRVCDEHRGERVPVALRADVHALHDQVDHAAGLREGRRCGARRARWRRGSRCRCPSRCARRSRPAPTRRGTRSCSARSMRGDDAVALGRGERAHVERRIGEHEHARACPRAPCRVGRADHAEHDRARVARRARPATLRATRRRRRRARGRTPRSRRRAASPLRAGAGPSGLPVSMRMISYGYTSRRRRGLDDVALVVAAGHERAPCAARARLISMPLRREIGDHELDAARRARPARRGRAARAARPPSRCRGAASPARGAARARCATSGSRKIGRRHEQDDAVPLQPPLGIALAEDRAQRARGLVERALEGRQVEARPRGRRRASGCGRRRARRCARRRASRGSCRRSSRCRRSPGSARARSGRGGRDRCARPSRDGCRDRRLGAQALGRDTNVRCESAPSGATALSVKRSGAPCAPIADSSGLSRASISAPSSHGHEQLDRAHRRRAAAVAVSTPMRAGAWRARSAPRARRWRRARCARRRTRNDRTNRRRAARRRGAAALGRVQTPQIGGHRDRAATRIAVAEPAPDAIEDAARRVGQVQQHVLRRLRGLELRCREPGLEPLARALGEPFDPRPLEDLVGASMAASATASGTSPRMPAMPGQRVLERRVLRQLDAGIAPAPSRSGSRRSRAGGARPDECCEANRRSTARSSASLCSRLATP